MGMIFDGCFISQASAMTVRLTPRAFNFEDAAQRAEFLTGDRRVIPVPGSDRTVQYDPLQRTAIGISRLGTSEAVAIGAYAFALRRLG